MIGYADEHETPIQIRRFRQDDGPRLFDVFHSAIHEVAARDYAPEQVNAWAPETVDLPKWAAHLSNLDPFVAELDGAVVGYADLQANGYIDHFYVSGFHARRGIGSALMRRIHERARELCVAELTSNVSLTAQPFFVRHGFVIAQQRTATIRGVVLANALMRKILA